MNIAQRIREQNGEIIQLWKTRLQQLEPSTKEIPEPLLSNSLPDWLERLAQYFSPSRGAVTLESLYRYAKHHGQQRVETDVALGELLTEYRVLRQVLFEVLERDEVLGAHDRDAILDAIQVSMRAAAIEYAHAQLAKRELGALSVSRRPWWERALVTLAIVATASIVQGLIWPVIQPFAYFLFYPAVTLASLYGDSILAIILSIMIAQYAFLPPYNGFGAVSWEELVRGAIFASSAFLISRITAALGRARRLAEAALLEQEQARRTADEAADRARVARSESELRAAELAAVVESIPDALYIGNTRGFTAANRAALRMLGFEKIDEIKQEIRTVIQKVHSRDAETGSPISAEEHPFTLALRGQVNFRDILVKNLKTGREMVVRNAAAPIIHRGRILGAVAISTDITEKKQFEMQLQDKLAELRRERELREQFVSTLSHDLRNPLTTARITAGMLEKRFSATGGIQALTHRIIASIDRADKMIRDLLDVNRFRAGERLPVQPVECDLPAILSEVAEELALIHGDRFVLSIEEPIHGYWSPDGIRRIIENLCTNAIKYGAAGAPITISARKEVDRVLLSVHNVGEPIPLEEQKTLFIPFKRTETAETSGKRGWGLGLALVKGIVEAHGGSISVQSRAPEGTTFTVELPLDARKQQAA